MAAEWFPLHAHSDFSLLDGLSRPDRVVARLRTAGLAGCALTDHGTICGVPPWLKALNKAGLRGVAGCEFYLSPRHPSDHSPENDALTHLCVLGVGQEGWSALLKATSASNQREFFRRKPRLDLETLASFVAGRCVAFSGHPGSDLANACFHDPRSAYAAATYAEARTFVREDWKTHVRAVLGRYRELFGDGFYVEIQLIDKDNLPASEVVARILRHLAAAEGVPCVATADSHYPAAEDAADQRVLLCSALKTTLPQVARRSENGEDIALGGFFRSNRYHIPTAEEMAALHTPEELRNSLAIAERCGTPRIGGAPMMPRFPLPDGRSADDHLNALCRRGWNARYARDLPAADIPRYAARVRTELDVIKGAGLADYFLVVADYVAWARARMPVGRGRGSGAGSLVSDLVGITDVDPVRYGLLFERFYNAGRNSPGRVALPDIDSDFPVGRRQEVLDYLAATYGSDRVCQIATYNRVQGRAAVKEVLRAHETCPFDVMNEVTRHIPDESRVADDLQEMREETGEASIVRWALEHRARELRPYCTRKADGSLEGPMAREFAQAIRLEGVKRNRSRHPSGVVIASVPLGEVAPLVWDANSASQIIGVDMRDAEDMGLVKFDILGVAVLDKLAGVAELLRHGRFATETGGENPC
jgi:DNA polymerase-3 subunit alpha